MYIIMNFQNIILFVVIVILIIIVVNYITSDISTLSGLVKADTLQKI